MRTDGSVGKEEKKKVDGYVGIFILGRIPGRGIWGRRGRGSECECNVRYDGATFNPYACVTGWVDMVRHYAGLSQGTAHSGF